MKLSRLAGSSVCACSREMRGGLVKAVEIGRQIEVIPHLQLRVVAGVIDALRLATPQRKQAGTRQVIGMNMVGIDIVYGLQHGGATLQPGAGVPPSRSGA